MFSSRIIGFCLVIILFFSLFTGASAQTVTPKIDSIATSSKYKNSFLLAPLISNTPETAWAFALAGVYIFKTNKKDSTLRTSTLPMGVAYTTRNQLLAAFGGTVFFPGEKYILKMENTYSQFPDRFWGLGNNTADNGYENYSFTQFFINPHVFRKIYKGYFGGLGWEYQQVLELNYAQGGYFDDDNVTGRRPYKMSNLGILLNYDTRNHAYVPNKGELLNFEFYSSNELFGSDFKFQYVEIELKKFIELHPGHVLGLHHLSLLSFGDVPFRSLGALGGNSIMRGYYTGRFRDKLMAAVQTEYRFPIYWRFGGVAFAGVGQVAKEFYDFKAERLKYSIGTGLRFALLKQEKLNVRFDVAWGNHGSFNYYVILAESF